MLRSTHFQSLRKKNDLKLGAVVNGFIVKLAEYGGKNYLNSRGTVWGAGNS